MATNTNFNCRFEGTFENVSHAGSAIYAICKDRKIQSDICDDIQLGVVEALNNIVEHAFQNQEEREISLSLSFSEKEIIIELEFKGTMFIPKEISLIDFDKDDLQNLPEGGFGLFLINELMDRIDYEAHEEKNIIRMVKNNSKNAP